MKIVDLEPFVAVEVLECPFPTISQAILMTAMNFCKESLSWTELSEPIYLQSGINLYEIDTPNNANLITVLDAYCNGRKMAPYEHQFQIGATGDPSHYNMAGDRLSISVYPTPSENGSLLTVNSAFSPSLTATSIPDFLDVDVISSGAKSRLMAMNGMEWANPSLAAYYKSIFDAGVIQARIEESHGRVTGTLRVKPRAFGI